MDKHGVELEHFDALESNVFTFLHQVKEAAEFEKSQVLR